MSSTDETLSGDDGSSSAGSPYDEPTQSIEKTRVRRPKPDNDDFFDRHGRRPAPEVKDAIEKKAARADEAADEPTETLAALAGDDVAPAEKTGPEETTGRTDKTAVIIKADTVAATENPVKKSVSDEPVRTEPFIEEDAGDGPDDAASQRRYAEHLTEPPLPYIEPQPTTPIEVDEEYADLPPEIIDDDALVPAASANDAPQARRGTLDLGLLILRIVVGATFTVHGLQKLTGWMNGPGQGGFADYLANKPNPGIGFHDNVTSILALVAGISETAGGILLVLGLLTPIAGAALLGTILMAMTYKATLAGGLWFFAADGGYNGLELEVLLAGAAMALILTGPGTYSFDRRWGWSRRPAWGSAAWVIIGIGAAVAIWILFNGTNPLNSPGNPPM